MDTDETPQPIDDDVAAFFAPRDEMDSIAPDAGDRAVVASDEGAHGAAPLPRRSFLCSAAAGAAGAAAVLGPLGIAGYAFVDPIVRRRDAAGGFVPVATTEAVPADGKPHLFRVMGELQDAWTYHGRSPLGAVYLRRMPESAGEVLALQTTCPHLGCFVSTTPEGAFHCPCHDSSFAPDGSISDPNSPSPRGLDSLEAKIEGDRILVRFQSFETGLRAKVPIL